jgi:ACS family sodium-dependent inorganic phosphate cotransporter
VLIARGLLSRTRTRKAFMAAALLVPAACLVACGRAASPDWAVALMTASIGVSGLASTGFQANYLEISATLSGVIMSVGNTIATLPGMTSPVLTGMILDRYGCSKQDPAACQGAYQVVFYIAFGVQATPPPRPPSLLLPLPVSLLCTHSLPP